ncbi:hypothetical protein IFM89_016096 [Coptis chinensis]|uniref:Serine-threonine/tyrosine-protein kinase catalytic domain-containing protein n=1 Tax=Coptis chinensis TaxID=261450 RepID=A0A835HV45_9MAGN|nr:hypothetical protein IFM89_016096 [Coptis chinensis]
MAEILSSSHSSLKSSDESSQRLKNIHSSTAKVLVEKFSKLDREGLGRLNYRQDVEFGGNVEKRVIIRKRTSGPPHCIQYVSTRLLYLAPEYTQSSQITEKANVYSFGVVLVELVTGRKVVDISRPKDQQCCTELRFGLDAITNILLGLDLIETSFTDSLLNLPLMLFKHFVEIPRGGIKGPSVGVSRIPPPIFDSPPLT